MTQTSVGGVISQSVFPIPGISRFAVSGIFWGGTSPGGATFEFGRTFSKLCTDIVESRFPPFSIEVVSLSELVMMETAIRTLGKRWKPVSFGSIFHLLADREAARVIGRASDTYFQVSNELFMGIIFLASLGENSWFIDAVPEEDVREITWLDSNCLFGGKV